MVSRPQFSYFPRSKLTLIESTCRTLMAECKNTPGGQKSLKQERPTAILCGVKEHKGGKGCEIKSFLFCK
jgi:hypothetical protein